jgi:hypothetical protein
MDIRSINDGCQSCSRTHGDSVSDQRREIPSVGHGVRPSSTFSQPNSSQEVENKLIMGACQICKKMQKKRVRGVHTWSSVNNAIRSSFVAAVLRLVTRFASIVCAKAAGAKASSAKRVREYMVVCLGSTRVAGCVHYLYCIIFSRNPRRQ